MPERNYRSSYLNPQQPREQLTGDDGELLNEIPVAGGVITALQKRPTIWGHLRAMVLFTMLSVSAFALCFGVGAVTVASIAGWTMWQEERAIEAELQSCDATLDFEAPRINDSFYTRQLYYSPDFSSTWCVMTWETGDWQCDCEIIRDDLAENPPTPTPPG